MAKLSSSAHSPIQGSRVKKSSFIEGTTRLKLGGVEDHEKSSLHRSSDVTY